MTYADDRDAMDEVRGRLDRAKKVFRTDASKLVDVVRSRLAAAAAVAGRPWWLRPSDDALRLTALLEAGVPGSLDWLVELESDLVECAAMMRDMGFGSPFEVRREGAQMRVEFDSLGDALELMVGCPVQAVQRSVPVLDRDEDLRKRKSHAVVLSLAEDGGTT